MNNMEAVGGSYPQVNNGAVIRLSVKRLYSIFIAILPLCMYYKFPFLEYGLGTVFSVVFVPYLVLSIINRKKDVKAKKNLWIILYFLYVIYRSSSDTATMLLMAIAFLHIIAARSSIDYDVCMNTVKKVSVIASCILLVQRMLSILGIHVSFFAASIALQEFTEVSSILQGQELTRMSGLFAEPAHFAEYALVGLILIMMKDGKMDGDKIDFKSAIIITLAILASTSGIGLLGTIAIWVYYILFHSRRMRRYPMLLRIMFLAAVGMVGLAGVYMVPTLRLAFNRIFGSVDGYNAVLGRSVYIDTYLDQLHDSLWYWGMGPVAVESFLIGVVKIIYQYGLVGLGLLFLGLFRYFVDGRQEVKVICLLYCGFLIASGMVGFLNYIFYISIIAAAFSNNSAEINTTRNN